MNGWKWTSWNELYCERFEKTAYGKWYWPVWDWGTGWHLQRDPDCGVDPCEPFIESKRKGANNLFPESKDIAAVTCREYASCQTSAYQLEIGEHPSLVGAFCENVNAGEHNCDRLNLYCPEGMKPNFDYVTCERIPITVETIGNNSWKKSGEWTFPDGTVNSKENLAKCLKDKDKNDENSITTTESTLESTSKTSTLETSTSETSKLVIKLCEDLYGDLFDETVDVSIRFESF